MPAPAAKSAAAAAATGKSTTKPARARHSTPATSTTLNTTTATDQPGAARPLSTTAALSASPTSATSPMGLSGTTSSAKSGGLSSSTSTAPPPTPQGTSKLPRFLQSPQQRDRSKSLSVDRPSSALSNTTSLSNSTSTSAVSNGSSAKGGRRLFGLGGSAKEKERARIRAEEQRGLSAGELLALEEDGADDDDPAEYASTPPSAYGTARPRTRSERHFSAGATVGYSASAAPDMPALARTPSRLQEGVATRLSGWFAHLSGSTADLSSSLSGSLSGSTSTGSTAHPPAVHTGGGKTSLLDKAVRYLLDGDAAPDRSPEPIWLLGREMPGWGRADEERVRAAAQAAHQHQHHAKGGKHNTNSTAATPTNSTHAHLPPGAPWPAAFHEHFYALVWCTYRAGFEPIRDLASLSVLPPPLTTSSNASGKKKWWPLPTLPGVGATKGWTSDTGWGCMLRTGQSLLAEAVGRVGAGADSSTPAFPAPTPRAHAVHARLLSWFLDSPAAPFGVHRMALAGKAQGKDVGMWFGPSAAAGAVRTLVDAFPACGLGVSVATDGTLYQTEVYAASHTPRWGDRPVLLLLGIRLGLDGVNPVYYETIKMLYTFPQSVGIAGGRPSSSYYFVGVQGDGLFYLDPHHSRPAVPLRQPPTPSAHFASSTSEPPGSRAGSQEPRAGSLEPRAGSLEPARAASPPMTEDELVLNAQRAEDAAEEDASGMTRAEAAFYQRAYAPAELRTFHCEKVRKMPLSGLDPSMLLGFVCRDEGEWVDLRRRIALLPRTIFAIQDEPPTWPGADDDDDMGLESVSDPEEEEAVDADDGEGSMRFFDEASSNASHGVSSSASHTHASTHYHSNSNSTTSSARTRSEEANDTEEDPVAPITPLPTTTRFDLSGGPNGAGEKGTGGSHFPEEEDGFVDAGREDDIEDDWVDPVPPPPVAAPAPAKKSKSASGKGKERKEKRSKTKKAAAVPVPSVHYPFPVSAEDGATGGGQQQQQRAEERERERQRNVTVSPRPTAQGRSEGQRMHTARARDGGRTQSGGVRGVLTTDD
ncbi:hypothetical protein C8J57DRAFT_1191054 [Mycena rebaudengoi]|nr:hypothetical protein C8J57DRAFT_1191054 [Mycena rebaudengoi]